MPFRGRAWFTMVLLWLVLGACGCESAAWCDPQLASSSTLFSLRATGPGTSSWLQSGLEGMPITYDGIATVMSSAPSALSLAFEDPREGDLALDVQELDGITAGDSVWLSVRSGAGGPVSRLGERLSIRDGKGGRLLLARYYAD